MTPTPILLLLERAAILGSALFFDRVVELPTIWHPVGWLGRLIAILTHYAPARHELWYGGLITFAPATIAGFVMCVLDDLIDRFPWPIKLILRGAFLSWTFSLAGLERAAKSVEIDLSDGSLDAARSSIRSLVSRPTAELSASDIAGATVESLAENTSDSVIAPLLWWSIGGPAAAAAYRAINTADAMVGYHGLYELLGRVSARLDDAVNLVPARLTGLALCAGSLSPRAVRVMLRDHGRTESPNAGWPMAAMAGALRIHLTKVDHYALGSGFPEPQPTDITRAIGVVRRAVALALPVFCFVSVRTR